MSIKIGSRTFAPSLLMSALTLIVLAGLLSLGRWQLSRAEEKRVLFDSFAAGADSTLSVEAGTAAVKRYQHVQAVGHFDAARQVLIDNMVSPQGQAGYYVLTPFQLNDGAWLLVNRGWVGLGASRRVLPPVPVSGDSVQIHGRADHLPAAGIQLGNRPHLSPPYPVVASYPTLAEVRTLLHETRWAALEVILLDAGEPNGYARQWTAPGFPPLRHIGYAVQWFALAAALVVIYFVTNTRRTGT